MRTGRGMTGGARAVAMAAGLAAAGAAHAGLITIDAVWVDPGGGSWATGSNWSNGVAPGNAFPNRYDVTIGLPGSYTVTYASGVRTIDAFAFTGTSALLSASGGTLNVTEAADIRGTYRSSGSHTLALGAGGTVSSTGVLEGNGVIVSNGLLRNEGVIRSRSGTLTLNANGGLDLDGNSGDGSMFATEAAGGGITVTGGLNDAFDGLVNIGEGNTIAFNSGWILNNSGALGFVSNGGTGDALLSGGSFESRGLIAVADVNARISAPTTFRETSTTTIASGGELELDGAVTFTGRDATRGLAGATFDGAGRLRFDGNVTVSDDSAATIRTAELDWDGGGAGHQTIVGRNSSLTIESDGVDQGDPAADGYDGTLTLNSGVLFAYVGSDWRMDGTVNLNSISGFNPAVINNSGAGRIDFRGGINVVEFGFITDSVKLSSTASVFLSNADTVLGFGGPVEIAGASLTGAGRIESFGDWFFSADTTIATGTVDFEATEISPGNDYVTLGANVDLTLDGTEITDTQNNHWLLLNGSTMTFNSVASGLSLGDLSQFLMTNSTVSFDSASGFFSTNGELSGSGTVDARFSGGADSHIIATGNLTLGKAGNASGFTTQGDLTVGGFTVTLNDSGTASLGMDTTIAGGTLRMGGGGSILSLGSGDLLSGFGTVEGRLSLGVGSGVVAEGGELVIDYAGGGGIQWNDVYVEARQGASLTILNDITQFISGLIYMSGGTINAENGIASSTVPQLLYGNGVVNARFSNGSDDEVEVYNGTLAIGSELEVIGATLRGATRIEDQTLELRAADYSSNQGLMTLEGGTLTSDGSYVRNGNGVTNATISGFGTLDLEVQNLGTIESVGGALEVRGLLSHDEDAAAARGGVAPVITGQQIVFNQGGSFTGNGTIDAAVATDQSAVLTATGDLAMGDSASSIGTNILGTLRVGSHDVELRDSNGAALGALTTIEGGTLRSATGVFLGSGDVLEGYGVVDASLSGGSGSRVTATGDLTIGNAASATGFSHGGLLEVGAHEVTLLDANFSAMDDITIAGGTLRAASGLQMSLGDTIVGYGTIDGPITNLQGDIEATGAGLTMLGAVLSDSTGTRGLNPKMFGTGFTFEGGGSFTGSGVIDAAVEIGSGGTVTATGDLTMGDAGSSSGFAISGGLLEVDSSTVTLRDSDSVAFSGEITMNGGTLHAGTLAMQTGIGADEARRGFGGGATITGHGTVDASITSSSGGSKIELTDDMTLGGVGRFIRMEQGEVRVGGHDLTLESGVQVEIAKLRLDGGTVTSATSILVGPSFGLTPPSPFLIGHGTINADLRFRLAAVQATGDGLVFSGEVRNPNAVWLGSRAEWLDGASFVGTGDLDLEVFSASETASIVVSPFNGPVALAMGDSSSDDGFSWAGTIDVGDYELTVRDAGVIELGVRTTLGGGTLIGAGTSLHVGAGGRIEGEGTIESALTEVSGTLAPGMSAGTLNIVGDLKLAGSAVFEVELGGVQAGEFDSVSITGDTSLAGTASVSFVDGFDAQWGDRWDIVSADEVVGGFDAFDLPTLSEGLIWFTETTLTVVTIGVRDVADVDGNGVVEFADLNAVLAQFGASGMGLAGDANGDGVVDFSDLNAVLVRFGATAPMSRAVPAPGGAALVALAMGIAGRRRRDRAA